MFSHKIPFLQLENFECDKEIVNIIPEEMARNYKVVALEKITGVNINVLTVGMTNPRDMTTRGILERRLNHKVIPFEVDNQELINVINNNYN